MTLLFVTLTSFSISIKNTSWAKPAHAPHLSVHRPTEFVYTSNGLETYRVSRSGALKPVDFGSVNSDDVQGSVPAEIDLMTGSLDSRSLFACGTQSVEGGRTIDFGIRYTIKPSGGLSLKYPASFIMGGPYDVPVYDVPVSAAFSAHGRMIYVLANRQQRSPIETVLFQYRVESDGSIAQVAAPTLVATAKQRPTLLPDPFIVADPGGKNVYVSNSPQRCIKQFRIAPDGHLKPVAAGIIRTGIIPGQMFIPPSGKYVYLSDMSVRHLAVYRIASNGSLTLMRTQTLRGGGRPLAFAFSPNGKLLYYDVTQGQKGLIFSYRITPGGILKPLPVTKTEKLPYFMVIDPDGRFAYGLANDGQGNDFIRPYRITSGGTLLPLKQFDMPTNQVTPFMAIMNGG